MNRANGYISLYRKLLEWEWHDNPNTLSVFIHFLLWANHEGGRFQGMEIKRGQIVTSLTSISTSTGMSFQQARTAVEHLISTGEITSKAYSKYRVITIVKYDEYQKPTSKLTSKQQAINKQVNNQMADKTAGNQQQYNNINNINNEIINKNSSKGFTPPTLDQIKSYIHEINSQVDPERFFDYYQSNGWMLKGGQKMKDWKATIRNWERREAHGERHGESGRPVQDSEGKIRSKYSFLRDTVINL